jgi:hypothetical protein
VAANAPALQLLDVSSCELGDDGLGPLVDALAINTHLRTLECEANNLSAVFARKRLLPAVVTNTSLRRLRLLVDEEYDVDEDEEGGELEEGLAIRRMLEDAVAARSTAPAGN